MNLFYRAVSEVLNTSMLLNQPNVTKQGSTFIHYTCHAMRNMNIEGWNNAFKPISNKYGIDLFGRMHFTVENIRCIVFLIYNNTYTFYDQVGFHVIWCQNYNHKQILLEEKPTSYLQPKIYKLDRLLRILKRKVLFQTISPNLVDLISLTYLYTNNHQQEPLSVSLHVY